ncbi:flagellar biosynthetic protein FliO [Ramlibacter tataouinensis]|uniref:flagellar biosynthetic protein FliO n=1 Tax=Ramlibacter tataouinensis TaxID=94132 RepID=UPI0022F3960F|nr:flagellar biosynthetic protein FliO [Ramlibacter tataouinensis]WBY00609.1 flagellar biosynthetic protein FliO [Ramlibacter tataouinensis]
MTPARLLRAGLPLAALAPAAVRAALPTVAAPAAQPPSAAAGLLQAGVGLVLVLALVFACAWVVRRLGVPAAGGGHLLKVVASAAVGQRERVVMVEVGGSWLVLGVAAGQVRHLHTLPAAAQSSDAAAPGATAPAFDAAAFAHKLRASLDALKGRS